MCLNKICAFFRKDKQTTQETDEQVRKLQQKSFEQKVAEVLELVVRIDGQEYLKAKELLQFMGIEIERIMEDTLLWGELQNSIVAYKLKSNTTSIKNALLVPLYTKVPVNLRNSSIHYAFNRNIVGFLKKHYTNPTDVYLISIIQTAYKQLKKS